MLAGSSPTDATQGLLSSYPHPSINIRSYSPYKPTYTVAFGDDVAWCGTYNLTEKRVELSWRWHVVPGTDQILGEIDDHATSYFPTGVRPLRDRTALVLGFTKGGKCLVECWTIGAHQKITTIHPVTGEQRNELRTGNVTSRTEVFSDDSKQLGPIFAVFENMGEPVAHSAFLVLLKTGTVLALDLTTGRTTTVMTSKQVSELGAPFQTYWQSEHPTLGYLYFLQFDDALEGPSLTQTFPFTMLVLEDTNRDGVIDGANLMEGDEFVSSGYVHATPN